MKKFLILLAVVPFMVTACKKDDTTTGTAPSAGTTASTPAASPSDSPVAPPSDSAAPSPATSPGGSASSSQVVGKWKLDVDKTVPPPSDKEKADAAAVEVEFKADGTYVQTGGKESDEGTWKLEGTTVTVKSTKGQSAPPPLTLSADGNEMTAAMGKATLAMKKV
jgi:hypothetical protein